MILNFAAVGLGAAIGAWSRWWVSIWLNQVHSHLPLGTLVANWGGGLIIGLALAFFGAHPEISPQWRLFLVTGLLGALTTFSTFSAEATLLLQRGEYLWALGHSSLHLFGSILFCIIGFAVYRVLTS